jgi:carbonic anhydrase
MSRRWLIPALAALSFNSVADSPHWDYAGQHGPAHWSELAAENATCANGKAQSPIDIRTRQTVAKADAPSLEFHYRPVPLTLINNGHTIQVNEAKAGDLTVAGHSYKLVQYHFHTPSEERINGKSFELVTHLVHKDDAGKLAVVAVLFKQGHANPALDAVLTNMPVAAGPEHSVAGVKLNAADLLPAKQGYYHFQGSLTTPPCSEGVAWYVLKTPVEASAAQIKLLHKLYQHTARPVQPLNGRVVIDHS